VPINSNRTLFSGNTQSAQRRNKRQCKKIIIISTIAVMKTSQEVGGPLDENTPIDLGNLSRGPYVWGKAEAKHLACDLGEKMLHRYEDLYISVLDR